jgi:glutaminyl-peptide cyclotransferase
MRLSLLLSIVILAAAPVTSSAARTTRAPAVAIDGYQVVHSYPHDPGAFTEGLFYLNGYLYESTGLEGESEVRKVRLETGDVVQRRAIPPQYFGEGIVAWKDRLFELTWKDEVGFIYDLATFEPKGEFRYRGEGWALTHDGRRLIMTDGTPTIRFLNPTTLKEIGRLRVTLDGEPLRNLNEVEWVKGEIYANVWLTDTIVRIDPATGRVVGRIDLSGLLTAADRGASTPDVLNGIAYDAAHDRLFVTGKNWPKLYEIKLKRRIAP